YSDPQLQAKPWDRLAGESHKAFNAFTHYRDLAERRTFQQVAEKLQCSGANVRRWAKKWRCYDRARDWDVEQDQQYQASHRERKRMREHLAHGPMMLQRRCVRPTQSATQPVKT